LISCFSQDAPVADIFFVKINLAKINVNAIKGDADCKDDCLGAKIFALGAGVTDEK
jgi:hypothetical protein